MDQTQAELRTLLEQCYDGDRGALDELLRRNLSWLEARVRRRLGDKLRRKAETGDFVQEVAIRFFREGPRFLISNEAQFRALLGRMVENVIRDQHDWFSAQRRSIDREGAMPRASVIDLDPSARVVDRPSQVVARDEAEAWTRLAVNLLDPEAREIVRLREWEGLPFADIGAQLDISTDSARMRFNRALTKLAEKIILLRSGQFEQATEADATPPE